MPKEEADAARLKCKRKAQKLLEKNSTSHTASSDQITASWQQKALAEMRRKNSEVTITRDPEFHPEIQKFQEESLENPEDVIVWWKKHSEDYPLLSQIAKCILCIPASSATFERSFSAAGLVLTPLRNGLDGDTSMKLTKISFNNKRCFN